ncbi:MAG: hypothetical protein ABI162_02710 [Luteolibacter sp.]
MTASSELDLKQRLAQLSEKEWLAMSAYLLRLKHQSKSGRRSVSKIIEENGSISRKLPSIDQRHPALPLLGWPSSRV